MSNKTEVAKSVVKGVFLALLMVLFVLNMVSGLLYQSAGNFDEAMMDYLMAIILMITINAIRWEGKE